MLRPAVLSVLTILWGAVLSPLFEPFVQSWLSSHGYYDGAWPWVSIAMNWVVALVGESAFPWVAGGMIGSAVGAWAVTLAGRVDQSKPSKAEIFRNQRLQIFAAKNAIDSQVGHWQYYSTPQADRGRWTADVMGKYLALQVTLKEIGILLPNQFLAFSVKGGIEKGIAISGMLEIIYNMSVQGHIGEAIKISREMNSSIETQFGAPDSAKALEHKSSRKLPPG